LMDRLQAKGAFIVSINEEGLELVLSNGNIQITENKISAEISKIILENEDFPEVYQWDTVSLLPLYISTNGAESTKQLDGILGLSGVDFQKMETEQKQDLGLLVERVASALSDRRMQIRIFESMEQLSCRVNLIQKLKSIGRYDRESVFSQVEEIDDDDLTTWVKDALTHYWGGPKLTDNPLMKLKVVQGTAEKVEGNKANALRTILRDAINQVKPEGDRRFTTEWILYNILEMKFLEGKKVREIALKLSMSEADLYRKQRVAIETVARKIYEMEKNSMENQLS